MLKGICSSSSGRLTGRMNILPFGTVVPTMPHGNLMHTKNSCHSSLVHDLACTSEPGLCHDGAISTCLCSDCMRDMCHSCMRARRGSFLGPPMCARLPGK